MCVVTQTVERVARELRGRAHGLTHRAQRLRRADAQHMTLDVIDAASEMEHAARELRMQAKLLDGKE